MILLLAISSALAGAVIALLVKRAIEPSLVHVRDVGNPISVAKRVCPIDSILYSAYPRQGLYQVVRHRDDSVESEARVAIFARLLLPIDIDPPLYICGDFAAKLLSGQCVVNRTDAGYWRIIPSD